MTRSRSLTWTTALGVAVATTCVGLAAQEPGGAATKATAAVKVQAPAAKGDPVTVKEVDVQAAAANQKAAAAERAVILDRAAAVKRNGGQPAVEQHLKNMEAQYARQFRSVLGNEIHFLRGVCGLDDAAVARIRPAGELALKAAVAQAVDYQRTMMTAGFRPNMIVPDPRREIQDGIVKAADESLTKEQAARYRDEIGRRLLDRKRAVIDSMLVKLDGAMVLSADQRSRIAGSLTSNWNDSWLQAIDMYRYGDQYLPNLPDNLISPHLDPIQKSIWQGAQKLNYWGFNINQVGQEVEPLEPEDVAQIKAAQPARGVPANVQVQKRAMPAAPAAAPK